MPGSELGTSREGPRQQTPTSRSAKAKKSCSAANTEVDVGGSVRRMYCTNPNVSSGSPGGQPVPQPSSLALTRSFPPALSADPIAPWSAEKPTPRGGGSRKPPPCNRPAFHAAPAQAPPHTTPSQAGAQKKELAYASSAARAYPRKASVRCHATGVRRAPCKTSGENANVVGLYASHVTACASSMQASSQPIFQTL